MLQETLWGVAEKVTLALLAALLLTLALEVLIKRKRSLLPKIIPLSSSSNARSTKMPMANPVLDDSRFAPQPARVPQGFTNEFIESLEWRAFERLVEDYYRACGFEANRVRAGADGGVDLILKQSGADLPYALVQCKAWNTYTVGVKPVRELFGVMAADGVRNGYFVASRGFTSEAHEFAKYKPLKLVTGDDLRDMLNTLPDEKRAEIFGEITSGDYTTPTCPSCDIKMVRRTGSRWMFWGCSRYPKCRQRFKVREAC